MTNQAPKSFWNFFVKNFRFTMVIVFAAIAMGAFSMIVIPKEANPEVDIPYVVVMTALPGASPQDVEELVTIPLENKLLGLSDVKVLNSSSMSGVSSIFIEFEAGSDKQERINNVKDKVDQAEVELPQEATNPFVQAVNVDDQPIFQLSLSGPYSIPQLKSFADELKKDIEKISGISGVNLSGGQEREIKVIINKPKLDLFGLSIGQVTNAIRMANADIPLGFIETDKSNYTVRFEGKLSSAQDIEKIPIQSFGNSIVLVRDVADVIDGFTDPTTMSRMSIDGSESTSSVTLAITKSSGGNILKISDSIREKIENAENNVLPKNISVKVVDDMSKWIRDDLVSLVKNGIGTTLIIIFILFLALGWKEGLLAGSAIPLTFLITFAVLLSIGLTLNSLSLFALILSLGILVDSSVVINESINTRLKEGMDARSAVFKTISDYKKPLISGTLTTVFAFVPMLMTGGIIGEFIKSIPITIATVLMASLFVGLAVITTISSYIHRHDPAIQNRRNNKYGAKILEKLTIFYSHYLGRILDSKRFRKKFIIGIIGLFLFSLSLPITGFLQIEMFPAIDLDIFFINFQKPIGTPLEDTSQSLKQVEKFLADDERIESLLISIGSGFSLDFVAAGRSSHLAHAIVNLKEERDQSSSEIISELSKIVPGLTDAEVNFVELSGGPPTTAPVLVKITGDNLNDLEKMGVEIENILKEIPGTRDVQKSFEETSGDFVISINREKAQLYGVTTQQIAGTLRNAISGSKATVIRSGSDDIDVNVKVDLNPSISGTRTNIIDISNIKSITIATSRGNIPLSAFTDTNLENSRNVVSHEDGDKIVRVSSNVLEGGNARVINKELEERISSLTLPNDVNVSLGGESEDIQESYNDMYRAMILAVFMIGALLVWQFNSFRQPIFILITIPLALIGVFPGLLLVGQPLSFPGIIGIVALAGIVVNNAIILIDRINVNRFAGKDKREAIIEGGKSRLRPILLTTITTVFGILPLAITQEMWGALAYSIIFGLLFSTVSTLVAVPILYYRFGEKNISK